MVNRSFILCLSCCGILAIVAVFAVLVIYDLDRESAFWENQNSMSLEVIEQYKNLEAEHKSTVRELEYEYGTLESEFDEFYSSFYGDGTKFLTIIEDGTVLWDFVDSKGNEYYWEIPMQAY